MKNILVTGGAGYIGSHIVKELTTCGFNPVVYDNLSMGHRAAAADSIFIRGDLAETERLDQTFKDLEIDAVIHMAASSRVSESVKKPRDYYQNNLVNSLGLLKVMLANGVRKMVFSSTAAVYGEPDTVPITEASRLAPTNPYGATKLAFEKALKSFAAAYEFSFIALRYFNAAGADIDGAIGEDHMPETHLIPNILNVALGKKPVLELYGTDFSTPDGSCIRDYIHVQDLACAHIIALEALAKGAASDSYNLGTEHGYSVREVIRTAEKVTGRKIAVKLCPRRAGDPARLVASSEKFRNTFGWTLRLSDLSTIIRTAWKWHSENPYGYNKFQTSLRSQGYKVTSHRS